MQPQFQLNPQPRHKADNYWNTVHVEANRILSTMDQMAPVYVTSIEDRVLGVTGGRVFAVEVKMAAQLIVGRTHRLSTPEEIAADQAHDKAEAERLAEIVEQAKEKSILKPSQDQMQNQAAMIGAVVKSVLEELRSTQLIAHSAPEKPSPKTAREAAARPPAVE